MLPACLYIATKLHPISVIFIHFFMLCGILARPIYFLPRSHYHLMKTFIISLSLEIPLIVWWNRFAWQTTRSTLYWSRFCVSLWFPHMNEIGTSENSKSNAHSWESAAQLFLVYWLTFYELRSHSILLIVERKNRFSDF